MFTVTNQEKQALVFVMSMVLLGLAAHYASKKYSGVVRFVNVRNELIKVDVNKASFDELVATRVISERLAKKIIERREERGPFRCLEDLRQIKGVGAKRLEKLKEYLYAG
jgi:competence ComEA-like helix-hairpin-helix protein